MVCLQAVGVLGEPRPLREVQRVRAAKPSPAELPELGELHQAFNLPDSSTTTTTTKQRHSQTKTKNTTPPVPLSFAAVTPDEAADQLVLADALAVSVPVDEGLINEDDMTQQAATSAGVHEHLQQHASDVENNRYHRSHSRSSTIPVVLESSPQHKASSASVPASTAIVADAPGTTQPPGKVTKKRVTSSDAQQPATSAALQGLPDSALHHPFQDTPSHLGYVAGLGPALVAGRITEWGRPGKALSSRGVKCVNLITAGCQDFWFVACSPMLNRAELEVSRALLMDKV